MTQYAENWETDGVGVPTGLTERWDTGRVTWTVADNQLNAAYSSFGYTVLSLDAADNQDDVDILFTFKCNNRFLTGSTQRLGLAARASGTGASKNAYLLYITEGNVLQLLKFVSNSPTTIASVSLTTALGLNNVLDIANRYISIRYQVNGTSLKAKIWLTFEEDEPASWDIDTTDSSITTGDWTGIEALMSSSATSFDIEALHISDVPGTTEASWNQVTGVIRDENDAVAARDVALFHRARKIFGGSTTSDGGNGTYTVYTPFGGEHNIVVYDDAVTGTIYNELIERVIPS